MTDIKMLKSWSADLQKEIAAINIANESLPGKKSLLESILRKVKSVVDDTSNFGSKVASSNFYRDQTSKLRRSESALSAIEFTGHDDDSTDNFVGCVDKIFDAFISDDLVLETFFVKQVKLRFDDNPYSRLKAASTSSAT